MVTKNQLTAYCLLAHINDNDRGISDLAQVFIPLVKKTLATVMATGVRGGNTNDMKTEFDLLFRLDIPFGLMHRLMRQIQKETNCANKSPAIVLNGDGSFVLSEFEFTELDEVISQQAADIELIEDSYMEFVERAGLKTDSEPSVFEFLDRYHQELSGLFATRSDYEPTLEYTTPALFVESVKNNDTQFKILRRIYLGSLISSYLQLPVTTSGVNIKELVLDTSFLVSLLDLTSVEACHTCQMVLELARKIGCKITVLDITLDETRALLERCSESIDRLSLTHFLAPTSIEAGCARRKLSKTGLLRIVSSLRNTLDKDHGVTVYNVSARMKKKAQTSELYKKITGRTRNPDGAHHDGVANYYVATKRGDTPRSLLKTQCWFVSSQDPHSSPTLRIKGDGTFFESIRAEYLLNVMWLSSPSASDQEVGTLGLSRLVATTIERSLPSHTILREFNTNLKGLDPGELTAEDVALLANSTAVKSAKNLEKLNQLAQTDKEQFFSDVLSIADAERERVRELEERLNEGGLLQHKTEKKQKAAVEQLKIAHAELRRMKLSKIEEIEREIAAHENGIETSTSEAKRINMELRWLGGSLILLLCNTIWSIAQRFGWQETNAMISTLAIPLSLGLYAILGRTPRSLWKKLEVAAFTWVVQKNNVSESITVELNAKLVDLQNQLSKIPQEN